MELRLNHHIDFEKNKTAKINNTNRVWYNDDEDLADYKLKQPQYTEIYLGKTIKFIISEAIHRINSSSELKGNLKITVLEMEECSINSMTL